MFLEICIYFFFNLCSLIFGHNYVSGRSDLYLLSNFRVYMYKHFSNIELYKKKARNHLRNQESGKNVLMVKHGVKACQVLLQCCSGQIYIWTTKQFA